MNSLELIYNGVFAVIAIIILYFLFGKDLKQKFQSADDKKESIIKEYEDSLKSELSGLEGDEKNMKKKELLVKFNSELSRNIFFNSDEVKEIILKFSKF